MQRDMFAKMLGLSMDQAIDFEKILCYLINLIPVVVHHFNGEKKSKTVKSAFVAVFEKQHQLRNTPNIFDIVLVDGCFLLHTLRDVPATFVNITKNIM